MGDEPVACLLRRFHEVLAQVRPPATDAHGERPSTMNNKHHRAYERARPQHDTVVEDDCRSTATTATGSSRARQNAPTRERISVRSTPPRNTCRSRRRPGNRRAVSRLGGRAFCCTANGLGGHPDRRFGSILSASRVSMGASSRGAGGRQRMLITFNTSPLGSTRRKWRWP